MKLIVGMQACISLNWRS